MSIRTGARTLLARRTGAGALGGVTALVLGIGLSACSTTLADVPLPGAGVEGDTIELTMDFDEALNLAKGAPVKVNGVDAGKVQQITAVDFHARTKVLVRRDADLRQGATARLRYTTPLGELFVDITNPARGALLRGGAVLGRDVTDTAPTVEDALAQASLLINGGGLAQLQTVTEELNSALGGREDTFRHLLEETNTFMQQANATTADIDRALRALSSTATTLDQRKDVINRALRQITPAARVLRRETPDFTRLLQAVRAFADRANSAVGQTREELLSTIAELEPVLAEVAANQGVWKQSLDSLALLGEQVESAIPGDYLNVDLDLHIPPSALIGPAAGGSGGSGGAGGTGGTGGGSLPDIIGGVVGGVTAGGGLLGGLTSGGLLNRTSTTGGPR